MVEKIVRWLKIFRFSEQFFVQKNENSRSILVANIPQTPAATPCLFVALKYNQEDDRRNKFRIYCCTSCGPLKVAVLKQI